jgi:hypothetical protein
MSAIVLGLAVTVLLLILLAVFGRGGAGETFRMRRGEPAPETALELARHVERLLRQEGFFVDRSEEATSGPLDLVARDPRPLVGQRVYVRIFGRPIVEPVGAAEVQSALDRIKGGYHKAVLVSAVGFSDEALAAAQESAVELLDSSRLPEVTTAEPAVATPRPAREGGVQ